MNEHSAFFVPKKACRKTAGFYCYKSVIILEPLPF